MTGSAGGRDIVEPTAPTGSEPHGLDFHDPAGRAQLVTLEAIAQAFGAAGTSVKLVVLSACYTAPIAEALLVHVDCVVGMSGSIHDDAARSFAIGSMAAWARIGAQPGDVTSASWLSHRARTFVVQKLLL